VNPRAARRRPTLSHRVEYAAAHVVFALAGFAPAWSHRAACRLLSVVWYFLLPLRRRVVLGNLRLAFPDSDAAWRARTARGCLAHFAGMMIFEFARVRTGKAEALEALMDDEVEGAEHYESAGGNRQSWVFVGGHIGNWELSVAWFARFKRLRTTAVVKRLHNPLMDSVLAGSRQAGDWQVVYTGDDILRPIMRAAREGRILAFLADQDARHEGVFVPFCGVEASTVQGPALFAYRLGLPIVVGVCVRTPAAGGRYRMRFYPPIVPDRDADRQAEIERLTREHAAHLEQAVREAPEQYFWFHRRWKTRP